MTATPPVKSSLGEGKSAFIDLVRGLAAFAVAAGHLRQFIFVDFGEINRPSFLAKLFYFATSLGHQAVMVFFVLSGFLVGRHVYERFESGRWTWTDYAIKRLTRLWIVLLPALALTALWDNIGIHFLHAPFYAGVFNWRFHSGPTTDFAFGWESLLANIFFLQTIASPAFGSNGPLWSLANEFWYYLIFPLGFLATRASEPPLKRVVFATVAFFLCVALPLHIVIYGLIWLMGFFVALVDIKSAFRLSPMTRKIALAATFVLFVGALFYGRAHGEVNFSVDFACALIFCVILYLINQIRLREGFLTRTATVFSEFSYTLYLTHFPFIALIVAFLYKGERMQPGLEASLVYVALLLLTIAYAYVIYLCFESRTTAAQRAIRRRLDRGEARNVRPHAGHTV